MGGMFFFFLAAAAATVSAASDEVTSLPGLATDLCFKHYAGYFPVEQGDKSLFYWFVEASSTPSDKPLLLWLNGGPGCSSLGGMFTELGPFVLDDKQQISLNPYSWNKVANVLFIEQPAGVGYSFPAGATNDTVTANDTYEALVGFLALHKEYQGRPFYVAGESYGGHYVPNIVNRVQQGNAALPSQNDPAFINIKGFAVGNAYTDWAMDFDMNVPYGRYHALASPLSYEIAEEACKGEFAACFWPRPGYACSAECGSAVANVTTTAMDGSIDIYDIYADVCLDGNQERHSTQAFALETERRRQLRRARSTFNSSGYGTTPISPIYPTCINDYMSTYLNTAAVQEAIHVKQGSKWADCGLEGLYDFNYESVVPLYEQWVKDKTLDILVYNGDADFIVNFMGSEKWIDSMQLPVTKDWHRWDGSDLQTAGYVTEYDGMQFATVKGAGHMVPKDRPGHALDMVQAFLDHTPLDSIKPAPVQPLCSA